MLDIAPALVELKQALDSAGIDYMIVGSLASSVHGLPRATRDADLVVAIEQWQVKRLATALEPKFYFSEEAALDAIRHTTSFNAIHEDSFFQIDMFIPEPTPFNRAQFERRQEIEIDPDQGIVMQFQSAEDTALSKLVWFREGHEVSERQWQDVLGIIHTQGSRLDLAYLHRWAANLGVDDLLQRALDEYWPEAERPEAER